VLVWIPFVGRLDSLKPESGSEIESDKKTSELYGPEVKDNFDFRSTLFLTPVTCSAYRPEQATAMWILFCI
jgi:hypothetical protein